MPWWGEGDKQDLQRRGGAGRVGRARQAEVQSTTGGGGRDQTNRSPKRDKRDKLPKQLPRALPGARGRRPLGMPAKGTGTACKGLLGGVPRIISDGNPWEM